jgi:hypothetical protein
VKPKRACAHARRACVDSLPPARPFSGGQASHSACVWALVQSSLYL